jgi:excisionase family DNA binding protein
MELTKEFYSLHEVADLLSVHYQTVRYWIRTGKLKAVKLDRIYRVRREAIEDFVKEV